ncbi:MAG: universal stress protein [Bacillota bacterium]|nr:universal stress protein [Bacillota bacterium]
MKILVCTDGSEQSQKALAKASTLAEGCRTKEVGLIHVCEGKLDPRYFSAWGGKTDTVTEEDIAYLKKRYQKEKEKGKKILQAAVEFFQDRGIATKAILEEGQPSLAIIKIASEEEYDTIVIGSRGLSGLKKLFLGSVSSAVLQEAKDCTVVVVK